jgi:hypothetical protein
MTDSQRERYRVYLRVQEGEENQERGGWICGRRFEKTGVKLENKGNGKNRTEKNM